MTFLDMLVNGGSFRERLRHIIKFALLFAVIFNRNICKVKRHIRSHRASIRKHNSYAIPPPNLLVYSMLMSILMRKTCYNTFLP